MNSYLSQWLSQYGVQKAYLSITVDLVGSLAIFLLASISYYIAKYKILNGMEKWVKLSKNKWDDLLYEHAVFSRAFVLVPLIITWVAIPHTINQDTLYAHFIIVLIKIAITFQVARTFSALLTVVKGIYQQLAKSKYVPLNAAIQVIKLVFYLVALILSISYVLDKSPLYLLSGLGALTAVLLLVFQDTIKGLVASIQISANKMVAPGDWIEMPQYGADGDVIEIGLNTVKVQNFDRTITTIPTYSLISSSFRNWRGMIASGGRRIKRCVFVDVASIRFYNAEEIEDLESIHLISDYLKAKKQEITASNQALGLDVDDRYNQRKLTNVGTFRAYIQAYLKHHPKVHSEMTCMVRQLPTQGSGLPIELYFFSNDQDWINYEGIQADVFDHIYAIAPVFKLRIFQHPSGTDWRERINS
ncbi:mechanosensitive ion channel family protein [Thalassotalea marina]|uniref:Mechanosensing system component YbdG n=1 Tax=Thalassotalea marina TaxID=1673741 RepID=A0A919EKC4_9GAMM|nr:mechanosensitive ion channel family protein [Thalassotalea marina]GHF89101.1 small conductance mechanosensitive ion channel protein YbdG [Thalassotalea marina]